MSEEMTDTTRSTLWRAVRMILKLLAVALIGLLIGIGVYALGVWTVNEIVTPLEEHAVRLDRVEDQLGVRREEANQLDNRLADSQSSTQSSLSRLTDELDAMSEELAAIEDSLTGQMAEIENLSRLEGDVSELEQMTEALEGTIDSLEEQQEVDRLTVERLGARLVYMRTMVLISRADSLIARAELAAAEQTIEAALQELAGLPAGDEGTQQEVEGLIQRLELALGVIQSRPEVASEDLDAAWALLAGISDN